MQKLNQVIAIEKELKSRIYGEITAAHQASKKPALFSGFSKSYTKKYDESEDYPPESVRVQMVAARAVRENADRLKELFDVVATKDFANCKALGSVSVDGIEILSGVPATFLLFIEKQLNDVRTFIEALPTLDPAEEWVLDTNSGLYKTPPSKTHRTKKIQKAIVLYPATTEHPAQTQLITDDEVVGYWDTVKHSGAIQETQKRAILERINKLAQAVKYAREEANSIEAPNVSIGGKIFGYLFP